jgi:hypothetical protein
MIARQSSVIGFVGIAAVCCIVNTAEARPAKCFTTDEGSFACEFRKTAADGSFALSAPGKPTYSLTISEPSVAYGFVKLGARNVPLPGRYRRSSTEPGCWVNDVTAAKICAY